MPDGKFVRKAKYAEYSSVVATTREEKMWLLNVMDSDEETGIGLKEMVGKEFMVSDIITRPYDSIDEDTGQKIFGVLTYLITPDKKVYVTSSKSIYFSVDRLMEFIGSPHEEDWVDIKVAIGQVKMPNGMGRTFKMVG